MRNPLSDKVVKIKPSGIRKFFDLVQEMPDAISLGVGEPDFDTPWHIREEGIFSLEKGRTFYTSNAGLMELRTAIAGYLAERFATRPRETMEMAGNLVQDLSRFYAERNMTVASEHLQQLFYSLYPEHSTAASSLMG